MTHLFGSKKTPQDKEIIRYLKNVFGFKPHNVEVYKVAFIHRSASNNDCVCGRLNNERLEYLGDAVLDAIVADYLFKKYPLETEGFLTEMRSKIVNRERLNKLAVKIGLHEMLKIDTHNYAKSANGDAFEAFVGAIYLDRGYEQTKRIVLDKIILTYLDIDALLLEDNNFKSKILTWVQKEHKKIMFKHQEVVSQGRGRRKVYRSMVLIDGKVCGEGEGATVKKAEQDAAADACEKLGVGE